MKRLRFNSHYALLVTLLVLAGISSLYLRQLGCSSLAIVTLWLTLGWPMLAFCYQLRRREQQQWQQLQCYLIALREGDSSYQLNKSQLSKPAQQLYQLLQQLSLTVARPDQAQQPLASALWQHLPYPVCLFDAQLSLLFANAAASHSLQRPLLTGSDARQLGFMPQDEHLSHPDLQTGWQQHSVQIQLLGQHCHIFYAADLRHPLYQQQKASQQKLIRVLSHELRNSLTPMASMTETLLSAPELPAPQTRQVLTRIQQRSRRLLGFIDRFLQLQQLPPANQQWLHLPNLINELPPSEQVVLSGEQYCYADPDQLAQLLLNLLKNAVETADNSAELPPAVAVNFFFRGEQQVLSVTDNGPGFANTGNLFTPFYTTKADGSGVGLLLCQEIMHLHNGSIKAFNTPAGHACVELCWPLPPMTAGSPQ